MAKFSLESNSTDATHIIGRELGRLLPAGAFVALQGLLGAGKTQLVKGIAWGLELEDWYELRSPTFVLMRSYEGGRIPLNHIDFYRLAGTNELPGEIDEAINDATAISVAEWAEVWPDSWPEKSVCIEMTSVSETKRRIEIDDNGLCPDLESALRSSK